MGKQMRFLRSDFPDLCPTHNWNVNFIFSLGNWIACTFARDKELRKLELYIK